jgi:hypothetical protein
LAGNRAVAGLVSDAARGEPDSAALARVQRSHAVDTNLARAAQLTAATAVSVQRQARKGKPRKVSSRRKRAAELGAPEALAILTDQVPQVVPLLSPEQIEQVQKVIDAPVINPDIEARAQAAEAGAYTQYGSLTVEDKKRTGAAFRIRKEKVSVKESDKRIRIDHESLLTPEVFQPTVINPDEEEFIEALRARLDRSGVWLRIGTMPTVQPWLSLGPDGDHIPAGKGMLTKKVILETTALGAMHYNMMARSPRRKELDAQAQLLFDDIQEGWSGHFKWQNKREAALPGVAEISEWVGDANYPHIGIWDVARDVWMEGWKLLNQDQTEMAIPLFIVSAEVTKSAAAALAEYEEKVSAGAAAVVEFLTVVEIAADVIGVLAGYGIVKLAAKRAAKKAVVKSATKAPGWQLSGEVGGEKIFIWKGGPPGTKPFDPRKRVPGRSRGSKAKGRRFSF